MSALTGTTLKGPWNDAQVVDFLTRERSPLRLALTSEAGFPLVVSLWFRFEADVLWCATHESSLVARRLAIDPRVGFEVSVNEMPYMGVRGQARVELLREEGPGQLEALLQRYLGGTNSDLARWLLSRADGEVALRLRPTRLTSWDFSRRMKDL